MAINYFFGWQRADLETALREAQGDLAAGKTTISARGGQSQVGSAVDIPPQERIRLLLQALRAVAPEDYPASGTSSISTTRAAFTSEDTAWQ